MNVFSKAIYESREEEETLIVTSKDDEVVFFYQPSNTNLTSLATFLVITDVTRMSQAFRHPVNRVTTATARHYQTPQFIAI
ncbi:hypothetical protein E2C01_083771 [Portunus trituberculatus]|uniref:Uncharacterized protein n=1 Tax=Portunus trituberculatus TaxID=210409 RepID=A0A5B7J2J7_PORTR|nr:hypothetical protein [Portunus trituberculatus]